jgi:hypothetical protein
MAPYDALADQRVAVLSENTENAWYRALSRLAADRELRETLKARVKAFCDTHFSGVPNTKMIQTILSNHPPPTARTRAARLVGGAVFRSASLGWRLVLRPFKRFA